MAREWWQDSTGGNLLKGVAGDTSNPIQLADTFIVDFLRRYEAARRSYNRIFPTLLDDEKERLSALANQADFVYMPDHAESDAMQNARNRAGVRTSGPMGGRRMQRW